MRAFGKFVRPLSREKLTTRACASRNGKVRRMLSLEVVIGVRGEGGAAEKNVTPLGPDRCVRMRTLSLNNLRATLGRTDGDTLHAAGERSLSLLFSRAAAVTFSGFSMRGNGLRLRNGR